MPSNDNRTHYIFISKTNYENFPLPQAFIDHRGPLYFPAVDEAEPVEMTPANATLKDGWEAYKGSNAQSLVKGFTLNVDAAPDVVDYVDAEYVSFGLDDVTFKELLAIKTAYDAVPDAVYIPALTHDEILHFQNTGEVDTL